MNPIVKWTMWQRRWSTMWWSFGVFAFLFINLVFYPTFKNQAADLEKSFQNLPDAALQLFGGSADFFSPVGFLNSQVFFLMLPLLLSILAISLGSGLIGREEDDMTIEMLLARPLSRARLLSSKVIAGLGVMGIVTLAAIVTVVVSVVLFDIDVPMSRVALATLNCFLLATSTGAVAFLLSATGRARNAAIGLGALIGIGGYLVVSLSNTVDWLKGPSKIFPFNYYQSEAILRGTYHWVNALFFIAVIAACGILSLIAFRRRDIA